MNESLSGVNSVRLRGFMEVTGNKKVTSIHEGLMERIERLKRSFSTLTETEAEEKLGELEREAQLETNPKRHKAVAEKLENLRFLLAEPIAADFHHFAKILKSINHQMSKRNSLQPFAELNERQRMEIFRYAVGG